MEEKDARIADALVRADDALTETFAWIAELSQTKSRQERLKRVGDALFAVRKALLQIRGEAGEG